MSRKEENLTSICILFPQVYVLRVNTESFETSRAELLVSILLQGMGWIGRARHREKDDIKIKLGGGGRGKECIYILGYMFVYQIQILNIRVE
jgi:hypothetical protein